MLYLVFDIVNKTLVSFDGSLLVVPGLYQTNEVDVILQFVEPAPGSVIPYSAQDVSTMAPRLTISQKATGVIGDENEWMLAQAVEAAWAWDPANLWFTGTINLDTAEMETYLGNNASLPAVMEVDLTTGGIDPETMWQGPVTVYANIDGGGPTPVNPVHGTGGTLGLQNGVGGVVIAGTLVTVAGLAWGAVPNAILVMVHEPATRDGVIFANYVLGSATQAGFQFDLSAVPPNNNYKFTYIPVFNAPVF